MGGEADSTRRGRAVFTKPSPARWAAPSALRTQNWLGLRDFPVMVLSTMVLPLLCHLPILLLQLHILIPSGAVIKERKKSKLLTLSSLKCNSYIRVGQLTRRRQAAEEDKEIGSHTLSLATSQQKHMNRRFGCPWFQKNSFSVQHLLWPLKGQRHRAKCEKRANAILLPWSSRYQEKSSPEREENTTKSCEELTF